jgi:hypothetical protein
MLFKYANASWNFPVMINPPVPVANKWTQVTVTFTQLGIKPGQFVNGFIFQSDSPAGGPTGTIYIDNIELIAASASDVEGNVTDSSMGSSESESYGTPSPTSAPPTPGSTSASGSESEAGSTTGSAAKLNHHLQPAALLAVTQ